MELSTEAMAAAEVRRMLTSVLHPRNAGQSPKDPKFFRRSLADRSKYQPKLPPLKGKRGIK